MKATQGDLRKRHLETMPNQRKSQRRSPLPRLRCRHRLWKLRRTANIFLRIQLARRIARERPFPKLLERLKNSLKLAATKKISRVPGNNPHPPRESLAGSQ